ncbi:MAG: CRISPR-associated endonuclease Cas1 [Prochlorotrichaceae cyanobacterium]
MRTLYLSQQGCHVSLHQEMLRVNQGKQLLQEVQLPLLEQVLVFGKSQVTTQAIRACLWRNIPIAYLSRMGYCYGRIIAIERGYRQLARYQRELTGLERLLVAQALVKAKLLNSRVILQRQQRKRSSLTLETAITQLAHFANQVPQIEEIDRLLGIEGAGANCYFQALGECLNHPEFTFMGRSRRPPGNPVNALLSFGYQVLWNHLLTLVELQDLDPYEGCLHQGSYRHAALVSDLIEPFRAPIVDALVLQAINNGELEAHSDFEYRDGGCFLGETGRRKWLKTFVKRMESPIQAEEEAQPTWDLLNRQVKAYKQFVYSPVQGYAPYRIR